MTGFKTRRKTPTRKVQGMTLGGAVGVLLVNVIPGLCDLSELVKESIIIIISFAVGYMVTPTEKDAIEKA